MKRHRGVFNPENKAPYELSRSRIENFVRCPACFHVQQVQGVKFPSIPGFNLNEATDILLKRDFDYFRSIQEPHPFLLERGYGHMIPFSHPNFELWTQALHFGAENRFHTVHNKTNLKIGGGIDDIWLNTETGLLHVVDYKSTSIKTHGKEISLDDPWKAAYKRQMDLYVWILRRMEFDVSDEGIFLYCDGDRFSNKSFLGETIAQMEFKVSILIHHVDTSWIEPTLFKVKDCLTSFSPADHVDGCEIGSFLAAAK